MCSISSGVAVVPSVCPTHGWPEKENASGKVNHTSISRNKGTKPLSRVQNPTEMINNHHITEQSTYILTQWEIGVIMESEIHN